MHLLLEQWGETMSVPVDGPAAHTRFSARVALYTYDFALVFIETHTHTHACSVICLCTPVRTEGRLALLKSLMACLWHPLWTPVWTKGHIYFWPADVENGAVEIIDFPFFTSSPLFLPLFICLLLIPLLLLPAHHPLHLFSLLLPQPGSLLEAGEDLLVSGATSAHCITYENRAVVLANTSKQVVKCKVQARLPPFLMVVIFGNCGYSLVRGFVHTSKPNYCD